MTIRQWSTTASGNSNAASINWQEGQAPSTVNNSAREMMAQIRQEYTPERWGWVACSATASVNSQTVFKLTGDQTTDYNVQYRRVKLTGGSATVYAEIVSASYTSETTVTIQNASGSLSSSMSIAWLSLVYNNSIPGNVVKNSESASFSATVNFGGKAAFNSSASFSGSVNFAGAATFGGNFSITATTVAGLPDATTVPVGSRAFVTDATSTTFGSVVVGGGSSFVPVYSEGTNWRIG